MREPRFPCLGIPLRRGVLLRKRAPPDDGDPRLGIDVGRESEREASGHGAHDRPAPTYFSRMLISVCGFLFQGYLSFTCSALSSNGSLEKFRLRNSIPHFGVEVAKAEQRETQQVASLPWISIATSATLPNRCYLMMSKKPPLGRRSSPVPSSFNLYLRAESASSTNVVLVFRVASVPVVVPHLSK